MHLLKKRVFNNLLWVRGRFVHNPSSSAQCDSPSTTTPSKTNFFCRRLPIPPNLFSLPPPFQPVPSHNYSPSLGNRCHFFSGRIPHAMQNTNNNKCTFQNYKNNLVRPAFLVSRSNKLSFYTNLHTFWKRTSRFLR